MHNEHDIAMIFGIIIIPTVMEDLEMSRHFKNCDLRVFKVLWKCLMFFFNNLYFFLVTFVLFYNCVCKVLL